MNFAHLHQWFAIGAALCVIISANPASTQPDSSPASTPDAETGDSSESSRADTGTHTDESSTSNRAQLIARAKRQDWDPDQLFSHLGLDESTGCLDYSDPQTLQKRHDRWLNAIELLHRIDSDALYTWLLGREQPPHTVRAESNRHLRCMFRGLVAAIGSDYDVRLFRDITEEFDGQFDDIEQLAAAIDADSDWLTRVYRNTVRSVFRNFRLQANTWHRKYVFTGRAFNRISEEAAETCALPHRGLWRPDHPDHDQCWHEQLSPEQRERQILQATAGPGISRHHWGTDVDILSVNPASYRPGGPLYGDWRWLRDHAIHYGFFQPYQSVDFDGHAHIRERWHWSYYPIAQALWEFVRRHPERVESRLHHHWERLEQDQWASHSEEPFFDHLRAHWGDYFFYIHVPTIEDGADVDGQQLASPPED